MKGALTAEELELRKKKAANLDKALEWLKGRADSEKLMTVDRILREGLAVSRETE